MQKYSVDRLRISAGDASTSLTAAQPSGETKTRRPREPPDARVKHADNNCHSLAKISIQKYFPVQADTSQTHTWKDLHFTIYRYEWAMANELTGCFEMASRVGRQTRTSCAHDLKAVAQTSQRRAPQFLHSALDFAFALGGGSK